MSNQPNFSILFAGNFCAATSAWEALKHSEMVRGVGITYAGKILGMLMGYQNQEL